MLSSLGCISNWHCVLCQDRREGPSSRRDAAVARWFQDTGHLGANMLPLPGCKPKPNQMLTKA